MKKTANKTPLTVFRPESEFRFDARLFAAVAMFKAKADIRYYLCGLCFIPHPNGGAMLAGTDGHQLGLAFDPEGRAPEQRIVAVTPGMVTAACKFKTGTVYVDGDRLALVDSRGIEQFVQPGKCRIEGKFPDVFRVLPSDPEKLRIGAAAYFNAAYVKRAAEAGMFLAGNEKYGVRGMTSWQQPPSEGESYSNSTCLHRFEGEPNFIAITMPMRSDKAMPPVPEFVGSARKAAVTAAKAAMAAQAAEAA